MRHAHQALRCVGCRLHPEHCVCRALAEVAAQLRGQVQTRLVVVAHAAEAWKSSNTGFLLPKLLARTAVKIRGQKARPVDLGDLTRQAPGSPPAYLLFPADDAAELGASVQPKDGASAIRDSPVTLVVADATWRQARRMVRRDPVLAALPRVRLPAGPPPRYRLRIPPRPDGLCTLEAVARALGILEGPTRGPVVQKALEAVLDRLVRATFKMRGTPYRGVCACTVIS